jgi:hypothetical protein
MSMPEVRKIHSLYSAGATRLPSFVYAGASVAGVAPIFEGRTAKTRKAAPSANCFTRHGEEFRFFFFGFILRVITPHLRKALQLGRILSIDL